MLFNEENIVILDRVNDWREAIEKGTEPLIKSGNVEKKYVNAMIKSIEKLGFYVVLTEDIAMPHARPEEGVNETGVSFLKLNEGVLFGENKINLIFVLAAKDKDSHIDTITQLLEIFQDDKKIAQLKEAKTINEIKNII